MKLSHLKLARGVSLALVFWLLLMAVYLLQQWAPETIFGALLTSVIAVLVLRRNRWGYFAAAAWGLACYQIAKEGFALADIKRLAMIGGVVVSVASVYLHEIFCRRPDTPSSPWDTPSH